MSRRAKRKKSYSRCPLDAADAAGAAFEREAREGFRTLTEHQKSVTLADARVERALARSPSPTPERAQALALHRARVAREQSAALAQLDARVEAADLYRTVAEGLSNALARTNAEFGARVTAGDIAAQLRAQQ
jgi:hypothetical protein